MNKEIFTPLVIIIIVVFAVIAAGLIVYWRYWWKPISQSSFNMSGYEKTGWETYEMAGFWGDKCSIKYPKDWKIEEIKYPGDVRVEQENMPYAGYITPKEKRVPEDIWVSINCFPAEKGYIDPISEKNLAPLCSQEKFVFALTKKTPGVQFKEYCILSPDGKQIGIANFWVRYGRQHLDYYIPDTEIEPELKAFSQMLSTFKFLEK